MMANVIFWEERRGLKSKPAGVVKRSARQKCKQREVPLMEITKGGVLGCGLMGSGIAQACATAGFDVISLEIDQKYIDKGFTGTRKSLEKFSPKGTLTGAADQILSR